MNNRQRITLACFLAYFVMSGMLSPIGIISTPMAAGECLTDRLTVIDGRAAR